MLARSVCILHMAVCGRRLTLQPEAPCILNMYMVLSNPNPSLWHTYLCVQLLLPPQQMAVGQLQIFEFSLCDTRIKKLILDESFCMHGAGELVFL